MANDRGHEHYGTRGIARRVSYKLREIKGSYLPRSTLKVNAYACIARIKISEINYINHAQQAHIGLFSQCLSAYDKLIAKRCKNEQAEKNDYICDARHENER